VRHQRHILIILFNYLHKIYFNSAFVYEIVLFNQSFQEHYAGSTFALGNVLSCEKCKILLSWTGISGIVLVFFLILLSVGLRDVWCELL